MAVMGYGEVSVMSVAGKVALITGATGNLGTAVVSHFVTLGATVVATYHHQAPSLPKEPAGVAMQADVTDEAQVERLVDEVHAQYGGPHLLLNLVGGYAAGQKIAELELATWQHMIALNLTSAFLCSKHCLKYMLPQVYGRIISVSSKAAFEPAAGASAYAVAKAGVLTLNACLAKELKGTGVSSTVIVPSAIDAPAVRESMPKVDPAKLVSPQTIAETLAWLASEQGGAANGSVIQLYGGL